MTDSTSAPKKTRKRNYINNPDFHQAIVEYKQRCDEAEANGKEIPVIPNYIGECFIKLAKGIISRPNFSNYTYREDMMGDGIINCVKYIRNYKEDKTDNPFAYFSRIIWNSYLKKISEEKKSLYEKFKISEQVLMNNATYTGSDEIDIDIQSEIMENYIRDYEEKAEEKKAKEKERREEKKRQETEEK